MASFNKVILVGNLGKDPEVRYTLDKKAVTTLSVATDARWKDAAGKPQERTDWHRVVVWGRQAELCGEHLKKGDRALYEGRLQTREYEKDGKKQYVTEVVAMTVQFLGGGKGAGAGSEPPVEVLEGDAPGDDASIPF
jgi:single-strand DNA-binding protein